MSVAITSNSALSDVIPMVSTTTGSDTDPTAKKNGVDKYFDKSDVTSNVMERSKIMIVDDEPLNIKVIRKYLNRARCSEFVVSSDPHEVPRLIDQEKPDLVLLDVDMPNISGLDILRMVRSDKQHDMLPVIFVTALEDSDIKHEALEMGATDFLTKPIDPTELVPRVKNILTTKAYQDRLRDYTQKLEMEIHRQTLLLEDANREIIHCLARASEYRDNETGRHVIRVGLYSGLIADTIKFSPKLVEQIQQAATLHDVGKIGIPDAILLKPGKLTPEEYEMMQRHSSYGKKILKSVEGNDYQALLTHTSLGAEIMGDCQSPLLKLAKVISLTHHEKWDGSGYPLGLAGEDIPIEGRIVAIADVFDALSSKRPYKPAFPLEKCIEILSENRGTHFDPELLDAFLSRRDDIVLIQIEHSDDE